MAETLTVVVCSREMDSEEKGIAKKIEESCGCDVRVMYVVNPEGIALTKIYSDVISAEEVTSDVVVFVHDDVDFLRNGWGAEILRLFRDNEEYGIIGVAGSTYFDEKAAWWTYEGNLFGQVLHRNDGKSWLSAYSPLLDKDLEEVCVVDGLFFAVHRKRITKNFDTELDGFNFYEIDFCLANFLDGGCKVGVTTNIRIAHNSMGELKDNWYKNREKIIEKYGSYFPIMLKRRKKSNGR